MSSKTSSPAVGITAALTILSCLAALALLLGMTYRPAASWLWIANIVMVASAVLAVPLGLSQRQTSSARICTIVATLVLALALGLFVWGGYSAEITRPV